MIAGLGGDGEPQNRQRWGVGDVVSKARRQEGAALQCPSQKGQRYEPILRLSAGGAATSAAAHKQIAVKRGLLFVSRFQPSFSRSGT